MSTTYGVTQEFVQSQSIGLFGKRYVGYFSDDFDFFTADKEYDTGRVFMSIDNFSSSPNNDGSVNQYSWLWLGYFLPPTSGDYTFYTASDDASWAWVGEGARRNTTVSNAVVNNGGVHATQEVFGTKYLRANKLYPVKIMFGDANTQDRMTFSFSGPGIAKTTDGRGYFLSGPYLFDSLYNTTTRTYPTNGYEPDLVLDFENNYFRVNGEDTDFDTALTHSRDGNATMVDSDGLIKWAPHNYYWDSTFTNFSNTTGKVASNEVFTSGDISVGGRYQIFTAFSLPSAGTYRFKVDVNVIVTPSDNRIAAIQAFTGGDSIIKTVNDIVDGSITIDFNVVSSDLDGAVAFGVGTSNISTGLAEFSNPRVYRIDLGGMVNNPDQTGSLVDYVPTTGTARYLARRGHHVYNGTEWVNEGVLIEREARTNSLIESDPDINGSWVGTGMVSSLSSEETNYLGINAYLWSTVDTGSTNVYARLNASSPTVTVGNTYTLSAYLKAGLTDRITFLCSGAFANIDLTNRTGDQLTYESVGNGWYRVSMPFTPNASPTIVRIGCGDAPLTLDGTDSFYVAGVQLEEGSTPSSYIPTTGATVTRVADSLSIPFANTVPASTDMSYSYTGKSTFVDNNAYGALTFYAQNNTENQFILALNVGGNNLGRLYNNFDGIIYTRDNVKTAGINVSFNLASRANTTEVQFAQDGTAKTVISSSGAAPTLTDDMVIASHGSAASNMTLKLFKGWGADIGTAAIEEASS